MGKIPFRAALFDLDGTLLDSMYVWRHVDEVFFAARGMVCPPDYSQQVAGMSYRETAEYTIEKYMPDETWENLIAEWTRLSEIEYAQHVPLKPGALSYLRMLRREGVRMAVVTAMPPSLFMPCLEHLGIAELFDELCSTDHVGGQGKGNGEIYLYAARKLGVDPAECAVFEDVLTGIRGARRAGMRAYCVRDSHSAADFAAMEAIADGAVTTLDEMRQYHDFPAPKRCVIFSAHCEGDPGKACVPRPGDLVLCADGGWKLAAACGVEPDMVLGDFDSSEAPDHGCVERHPVMKDDTDTLLCVRRALKLGYEDILIVGGFGGRLDHTIANLQTLHFAAERGCRIAMDDGVCRATVIVNGSAAITRRPGKLSVFSLTPVSTGVSIRGALYEISDAVLTSTFPIGVSNEPTAETTEITVKEGALLILQPGAE